MLFARIRRRNSGAENNEIAIFNPIILKILGIFKI